MLDIIEGRVFNAGDIESRRFAVTEVCLIIMTLEAEEI
jgi:hypothetical protein